MKISNLVGRAFGTIGLAAATLELDFSASSPLSESESLLSEESEESLGDCNIHVGSIWCDNFISSFKRYVHKGVFDNFLKKKTWRMRNHFHPSLFLAMMLEPRKRLVKSISSNGIKVCLSS